MTSLLSLLCLTMVIGAILVVTSLSGELEGQSESPTVNITESLIHLYPFVTVEYETNSMLVLRGDEDSLLVVNGTLAPFWDAVDSARSVGYVLDDVTTSGMGSQGNPTRFYAIMTK